MASFGPYLDKIRQNILGDFCTPLCAFKAFQPVHLEITARSPESDQSAKIYVTLTLEREKHLFSANKQYSRS